MDIKFREQSLEQKEKNLTQWKSNLLNFQTQLNMNLEKTAFDMTNSIVPKKAFFLNRKSRDVMKEIAELVPEPKKMMVPEKTIDLGQKDN